MCIVLVRKQDFRRIVEPQKIQAGREFMSSCSQQGQLWVQTWLLRALSQWVLKSSKTAASLGHLTHCWAVVKVKKFHPVSSMNVSWPSLWPMTLFLTPHSWERPGSISLITSFESIWEAALKAILAPGLVSQHDPTGQVLPLSPPWGPSPEHTLICWCLSCYQERKTELSVVDLCRG